MRFFFLKRRERCALRVPATANNWRVIWSKTELRTASSLEDISFFFLLSFSLPVFFKFQGNKVQLKRRNCWNTSSSSSRRRRTGRGHDPWAETLISILFGTDVTNEKEAEFSHKRKSVTTRKSEFFLLFLSFSASFSLQWTLGKHWKLF